MEVLKKEEMLTIDGGAIKTGIIVSIFGFFVFVIGVIDGIFRPLKCNR